jgi:hypothetical protein
VTTGNIIPGIFLGIMVGIFQEIYFHPGKTIPTFVPRNIIPNRHFACRVFVPRNYSGIIPGK